MIQQTVLWSSTRQWVQSTFYSISHCKASCSLAANISMHMDDNNAVFVTEFIQAAMLAKASLFIQFTNSNADLATTLGIGSNCANKFILLGHPLESTIILFQGRENGQVPPILLLRLRQNEELGRAGCRRKA